MLYIRIAMELFVAIFAVLGLYVTVRWCCGRLFGTRNLLITIEILTQREAESAEVLIRDALSQYLSMPWVRWAVLTVPELAEHPQLVRAMETYGLMCYVLEPSEE